MKSWICENLPVGWLTVTQSPYGGNFYHYSCGVDDDNHCSSKGYHSLERAREAGIRQLKHFLKDIIADAQQSLEILERAESEEQSDEHKLVLKEAEWDTNCEYSTNLETCTIQITHKPPISEASCPWHWLIATYGCTISGYTASREVAIAEAAKRLIPGLAKSTDAEAKRDVRRLQNFLNGLALSGDK